MSYAMNGDAFGAGPTPDYQYGCGKTQAEKQAIQTALNQLGFTDIKNKPLTTDGKWGAASAQAMAKAILTFTKEKKIKSAAEICNFLKSPKSAGAPTAAATSTVRSGTATAPAAAKDSAGAKASEASAPAAQADEKPKDAAAEPAKEGESKGMSRNVKLAVAFGGLAIGGLVIGSVLLRKPKAKANRRSRRKSARKRRS